MISADRQQLDAWVKQETHEIRLKELDMFTSNFAVLATTSSFLTGLGFKGLTMVPVWEDERESKIRTEETLMYLFLSLAIGFNMLTLCVSIWSQIFGPGLALRGPEGSMSRAVEGMYIERKWALRFYGSGLIFMVMAGCVLGWLKFGYDGDQSEQYVSFCISSALAACAILVALYIRFVTRPKFRFPENVSKNPQHSQFHIQGLDPELGKFVGGDEVGPKGGDATEQAAMALEKLRSLEEQGVLTSEQAAAKRNELLNAMLHTSSTGAGPAAPPSPQQQGGGKMGHLLFNGKVAMVSVDANMLVVFDADGVNAKKKLALGGNSVSCEAKGASGTKHPFVVTVGKTKLTLSAQSEEDRGQWMAALSR